MYNYESGLLKGEELRKFKNFLDKEIGTYYEVGYSEEYLPFMYKESITVFDLTSSEVDKIRAFEKSFKK